MNQENKQKNPTLPDNYNNVILGINGILTKLAADYEFLAANYKASQIEQEKLQTENTGLKEIVKKLKAEQIRPKTIPTTKKVSKTKAA